MGWPALNLSLISEILSLSLSHTAGMQLPIVEGQTTEIEIPKGTSDLGIGVSWCETTVSLGNRREGLSLLSLSLSLSLSHTHTPSVT